MKFNRNYRLTIDLNDGGQAIVIDPPFTIDFSIQRTAMSQLNHMNLTIFNLAEKTRQRIFQDRYRIGNYKSVILEAGYGDSLSTLYKGSIFEAHSELVGTDIRTNINSRDGFLDIASAQSNKTFEAGTTLRDLVGGLTDDFANIDRGAIGGDDYVFQRPVTVEGNTYDNLKTYTRNNVFVDLQRINVLNENQVTDDPVFLINADTGLLETPRREESFLTLTTLFEPRINMGQEVKLESAITPVYNGAYKVIGVSHMGTISEAVGGTLVSKFNLLLGAQLFGRFEQVGTE